MRVTRPSCVVATADLVLLGLAIVIAASAVAAWWWARRGARAAPTLAPAPPDALPLPRVSIIVPARNEMNRLPALMESLLALHYPDYEVIVVDGASEDGTLGVAQAYAERDARVRAFEEPPLPADWIGKSWAAHEGRRHATGAWLLFTDADTVHAPDSLRRAVTHAQAEDARFVTGITRQDLRTFWERVAMPPIFMLIEAASGGGEADLANPESAIANGQYMLFRADAYDALGGHESVRGSIVEDLALARLAARRGVPATFAALDEVVTVRMYENWPTLWRGWRKNVGTGAAETPPAAYAATVANFVAGTFPLPVALAAAVVAAWPAAALALAAYALTAWRVRDAHRATTGVPQVCAWLHPIGFGFFGAVLAASAFDRWTGRGPEWRGRRYPGRPRSGEQ